MTPPQRSSPLGTLVVAVGVVVIGWMAVRKMVSEQSKAMSVASASANNGAQTAGVPQIPAQLLEDAGKLGALRFDVTLRMDGLDLTIDGAPACRDGHRRKVSRNSGNAPGSFDESALVSCVQLALVSAPQRRPIALIVKAGPAVPSTYVDALIAALKRAGIADVLPPPS